MLHNKTGKYRGVSLKEEHSISDTTLLSVMNILIKEFFDLEFSALWGGLPGPSEITHTILSACAFFLGPHPSSRQILKAFDGQKG